MGGMACAKEIIDHYHRLTATLGCMAASIQLAAVEGRQPTYEQRDEFHRLANATAICAQDIAKSMGIMEYESTSEGAPGGRGAPVEDYGEPERNPDVKGTPDENA